MRAWSGIVLGCGVLVASCGGKTNDDTGSGGAGASGGSGGSGGGGAVSGSGGGSGSGGAPLGGAGGTAGCGPVDTGEPCKLLGETGCLAAYPRCAPVYDDKCCPMCEPTGTCADCMNWHFYECIPREESSCVPGAIGHCGQTPDWACKGGKTECKDTACQFIPGCYEALTTNCPPDAICAPECHAVTPETCGPACGPPVPMPACPNGGKLEVQNGKYTGYCIETKACAPPVH